MFIISVSIPTGQPISGVRVPFWQKMVKQGRVRTQGVPNAHLAQPITALLSITEKAKVFRMPDPA